MEALEYKTAKKQLVKFQVSIGVSMLCSTDNDLEAVLHKADLALYEAKKLGRNRVEVYEEVSE